MISSSPLPLRRSHLGVHPRSSPSPIRCLLPLALISAVNLWAGYVLFITNTYRVSLLSFRPTLLAKATVVSYKNLSTDSLTCLGICNLFPQAPEQPSNAWPCRRPFLRTPGTFLRVLTTLQSAHLLSGYCHAKLALLPQGLCTWSSFGPGMVSLSLSLG